MKTILIIISIIFYFNNNSEVLADNFLTIPNKDGVITYNKENPEVCLTHTPEERIVIYIRENYKYEKGVDIDGFRDIEKKGTDKSAIVDENGTFIVPFGKYDYIEYGDNGVYIVGKNNKYGCIDKDGKTIFPIKYNSIDSFAWNGVSIVKDEKGCRFVNSNGKYLTPYILGDVYELFSTNYYNLFKLRDEQAKKSTYFYFNSEQKLNQYSLPANIDFLYAKPLDDLAVFDYISNNPNSLYGYINYRTGEIVIKPMAIESHVYNNKTFAAKTPKGVWKYQIYSIVSKKPLNDDKFDDIITMKGYYIVKKKGKHGIINIKGEYLTKIEYDSVYIHRVEHNEISLGSVLAVSSYSSCSLENENEQVVFYNGKEIFRNKLKDNKKLFIFYKLAMIEKYIIENKKRKLDSTHYYLFEENVDFTLPKESLFTPPEGGYFRYGMQTSPHNKKVGVVVFGFHDGDKALLGACDYTGKLLFPLNFTQIGKCINGLMFANHKDGRGGYIDITGKFVLLFDPKTYSFKKLKELEYLKTLPKKGRKNNNWKEWFNKEWNKKD